MSDETPAVVTVQALRAALINLTWLLVADEAACSCEDDDPCPGCEAFNALGLGDWPGPRRAGKMLLEAYHER